MPIYEYKCPNCGKVFEVFWRTGIDSTAISNQDCPDCGTSSPKIITANFSFQFSPYLKELKEGNMLDY